METDITHSTIQMLVITPFVPSTHYFQTVSPWKSLPQLGDCCSWNYVLLCINVTGKHVRVENVSVFLREERKIARPHAFSFWCHLEDIMI